MMEKTTLRDLFAMVILHSRIVHYGILQRAYEEDDICGEVYTLADAMMEARKK